MTSPRIVLVDHRRLLREAVGAALATRGVVVAATASGLDQTLLQVQRVEPDVAVVQDAVPRANELLLPALRAVEGRPRVLVLAQTATASDSGLQRAIEAGADGYVTGRGGITGLADAIRTLAAGGTVVPPDMLGPLLRGLIDQKRASSAVFERLVALTPREREILLLVAEGLDPDGIAQRLVISAETARTHVQRVLRKLDVGSRLEAVTLVRRYDLAAHLERIIERTAS